MDVRTPLKKAIEYYLECAERMPACPVGDKLDMRVLLWIEEMDGVLVGL
jgi:hypothetical protein